MVPPDWPFDILSGSSSGSAKRLRTEALGDEFAEFEVYAGRLAFASRYTSPTRRSRARSLLVGASGRRSRRPEACSGCARVSRSRGLGWAYIERHEIEEKISSAEGAILRSYCHGTG